jgi:GTPase SAR1 family protein
MISCISVKKSGDHKFAITKTTQMCFNDDELNNKYALKECKKRSKLIEKELKKSGKILKSTIKLLLLGTGESGKSTVVKQMRLIHTSKFTLKERQEKVNDIKSNIRDSILSILDAMQIFHIKFENDNLNESREFIYENIHLFLLNTSATYINNINNNHKFKDTINTNTSLISNNNNINNNNTRKLSNTTENVINKLWDSIEEVWKDNNVKKCAKRGNEFHLIDSAQYFLDRINIIRQKDYTPDDQDILRCRVLTTGILETQFFVKKVNFHIFDVGGQRDQRKKWIQCFNQVTAIIFVVDISSFNMTIREDGKVNRLIESLESFRQIWVNRYLYHISIILFLNKYDIFVDKIVHQNCKLEDYFPDYKFYQAPSKIDKHLTVPNEHPEITKAKMFILELFIQITNEKLIDSMVKVAAKTDEPCSDLKPNENGTINDCQQHESDLLIESIKPFNNQDQIIKNDSINDSFEKFENFFSFDYDIDHYDVIQGKFCIPYFCTAIDSENMKRIFKACSHILIKEHLISSGLM